MGKKQHQKDKLYLTATEWANEWGGKKKQAISTEFKRLPYYCCSLSMQPFENPYCTTDGVVYDLLNIMPFLKQYGMNPVSGVKMTAKDLVKLNFHKNKDDKFHCPVTFKIFNENSHIVAVKPTGNVYLMEAIDKLNIKPSNWRDLLSDEPFTRKDVITIQDPSDLTKFNYSMYFHVKKGIKAEEKNDYKSNPLYNLKSINPETRDSLKELGDAYQAPDSTKMSEGDKFGDRSKKADKVNAALYSTGRVAASLTSTVMGVETQQEFAVVDEDIIRYQRIKKKAYLRITTNLGNLNIELHSDLVPKTCENFLKHCKSGYYDNTIFHRSIRNFMIQGGDPTGKGTGGDSIWNKPFPDEFHPKLKHSGRGILSMANSGENSNKSQFFITFRSATGLNGKHTVFGRVVGGLDVIDKMEKIETDKRDKPKEEIKFLKAEIFVDPYEDADDEIRNERESLKPKEEEKKTEKKSEPKRKVYKSGVGKYINPAVLKHKVVGEEAESSSAAKKSKVVGKSSFNNFNSCMIWSDMTSSSPALLKANAVDQGEAKWPTKKIVVVGDKGSGKTSLITQFSMGLFCQNIECVNSSESETSSYGIIARVGGHLVSATLWDTDSGDQAEFLRAQCYKDADCVILVFSVVCLKVTACDHRFIVK
ncbi:DgyrCDS2403 [Dimorphilus gyrociliatus]|uniref:RING-type E3 ubiquitin-protein ligase PPIL2 n=1 Tax=Dimorphilus gyrociliatus TaxID=2664684 RepID=A0A7I8VA73_9ANNE|nr:DgyrCDS2403 [Dimorphilus gyrociliatus]